MSRSKDDSGQAFPCLERCGSGLDLVDDGMTLRQYAAIKLRVPNSGTDWLDEMIRESLRNEIAAMAMQGFAAFPGMEGESAQDIAGLSYIWACAMLKAREQLTSE